MRFSSLLLYLFSLAVAAGACWQAQKLVKTFRLYFLSSFLGYLIAIGIVFILNLAVTDLARDVLRNIPAQGLDPVYILFGLVAFPLLAVAFYFVLTFISGILDEEFSSLLRLGYILLWTVLFVIFLTRIQFALRGQSLPPLAAVLSLGSGLVAGVIPIAIYAYLIVRAAGRTPSEERAALVRFGVVCLAGWLMLVAAMIATEAGPAFRWSAPVLLGLATFSPVVVLKGFLSRFYGPVLPGTFDGQRLVRLAERYQLSNREGEILGLLLRGRSNKEIERHLFISPHTVRNHIHNIYQKLGVGSRLQLLNFIRNRSS